MSGKEESFLEACNKRIKDLSEAVFTLKDAEKPNHNYLNDVINYILDNKSIKLGEKGDRDIDLSSFLTSSKKSELKKVNNVKDFDKAFEGTDVKWNKIFKGSFSGHAAGQQSVGEGIEPVIAYIYNNGADDSFLKSRVGDDLWIEVAKKVANFINNNWSSKKYIAAHVNGNDIDNIGDYKNISSIFKSKEAAGEILKGDKGAFKDLYLRQKDDWNKADIVLIRKNNNILSVLSKANNSDELNSLLRKLAKDQLIPISLKKIDPSRELRIVPEGFEDQEIINASEVNVIMPVSKLEDNSNNCSVILIDNNSRKIQFRRQSDSFDNLSIEANLGTARGGKAITKVKSDLGVKGNDWYSKPIKSARELSRFLNSNFSSVSNPSELVTSHSTGEFAWFNRTCFRGLKATYELYTQKYKGDCNSFFDWIYSNSTTGTGAFYLIIN